jgi:hypothetical protein
VCGKESLEKDVYFEIKQQNNSRLYFDGQECLQKFKQDKRRYMQKFRKMAKEDRGWPPVHANPPK